MSAPSISSVTAAQGTGGIVKDSVIELVVNFTADNDCDFYVELSLDNGSSWHDAVTHEEANGLNVTPSTTASILIDTQTCFNQGGYPARAQFSQAKVRVTATDPVQSLSSSASTSSAFALKATIPVINSAGLPQYVGAAIASATSLILTGHNGNGSTLPTYFRANLSITELEEGSSQAYSSYGSGAVTFAFAPAVADGSKTVYVRTYDTFYNASVAAAPVTWLQRNAPADPLVTIVGSVGNSDYTGIAIADDGSFSVDREATVSVRATSAIPVTFKILPTSDVEDDTNIDVSMTLNAVNAVQTVSLTTNASNPEDDNFNTDATVTVSVRFTDAANNSVTASAAIRLNTRIYQTAYSPIRENTATYAAQLSEISSGGLETVIPASLTLSDNPTRIWSEIFYPESHSYPTLPEGGIDEEAAIEMGGESNSSYDAALLDDDELALDSEQRPLTTDWTDNGSKNYGNMVSATAATLKYWVIDATGYGSFALEFEHFDLDSNTYGPPFNNISPHRGDVLVVYDASEVGALSESVDEFGQPQLTLADSTKLEELMAFTGSGTNVTNLVSGQRVGSNPDGGFTTDPVVGASKLVLIFYSDASQTGSGFKLKASAGVDRIWKNYDVDRATGEVWVHKHVTLGTAAGAADTTTKRMIYDYLENPVEILYDEGIVRFPVAPSGLGGDPPFVDADYSYHNWTVAPSNLWIAAQDDFVDYADAPAYLNDPDVSEVITEDDKSEKLYEIDGYGRLTTGFTWDKDRGVLELDATHVPVSGQRPFADYSHHTYKRLSNDGHGDLLWHDSIVVADVTPLYPDYTFADVKIVNEGDAMLEDAKFKFVPRGYDTNNDGNVVLEGTSVVDQVLDINRPWDIQRGTKLETYDKMAMEVQDNFLWDRTMVKADAMTILGVWKDHVFGDIAARGKAYGRAVWVLGGGTGSAYPATTAGVKRCSMEATGKYYATLVI